MALSRTIDTDWDISVPGAYCRAEAVLLASKESMTFHLRSYTAAENVPSFAEEVFQAPYDIEGGNPIKQAYEYLKTLPEFESAEDC
jgi:hypothetical protein